MATRITTDDTTTDEVVASPTPRAPPDVGEDTQAILCGELGLAPAELDELRRDGIV